MKFCRLSMTVKEPIPAQYEDPDAKRKIEHLVRTQFEALMLNYLAVGVEFEKAVDISLTVIRATVKKELNVELEVKGEIVSREDAVEPDVVVFAR